MKPLYIDAGPGGVKVALDGPSLEVLAPGAALRRYPLARLARIVLAGSVDFATDALLACLERGVAVTFLNRQGEAAGYALPSRLRSEGPSQRVENFLARPDWAARYQDWRKAAERREILGTLRTLSLYAPDLRPAAVKELLERRLGALAPADGWSKALSWLRGLLSARVAEFVAGLGLDPRIAAGRRDGFHLPADLTEILSWRLYADLAAWLETGAAGPMSRRALTSLGEQLESRDRNRMRRLWDSFLFWLGGQM